MKNVRYNSKDFYCVCSNENNFIFIEILVLIIQDFKYGCNVIMYASLYVLHLVFIAFNKVSYVALKKIQVKTVYEES